MFRVRLFSAIYRLYDIAMSKGPKPLYACKVLFQVDEELRNRISDFRFGHRFKSEAETIRTLASFALDLIESGEPPPMPGEDEERVLAYAQKRAAK